jgi:uncharacterized RDD family membrane protein YckC
MTDSSNQVPAARAALTESSAMLPPASRGQRFATMLLDLVFFYAFAFVLGIALTLLGFGGLLEQMNELLLGIVFLLFYYVPQEANNGRTLGKLIMKTRAVSADGRSLSFGQALARTLCRLIPFEAFSFLGGDGFPRGWHDTIPKTRVVSLKEA